MLTFFFFPPKSRVFSFQGLFQKAQLCLSRAASLCLPDPPPPGVLVLVSRCAYFNWHSSEFQHGHLCLPIQPYFVSFRTLSCNSHFHSCECTGMKWPFFKQRKGMNNSLMLPCARHWAKHEDSNCRRWYSYPSITEEETKAQKACLPWMCVSVVGYLRCVDYQAVPLPLDVIFRWLFSDIQAIKLQLPSNFFFPFEYHQRDLGVGRHW